MNLVEDLAIVYGSHCDHHTDFKRENIEGKFREVTNFVFQTFYNTNHEMQTP